MRRYSKMNRLFLRMCFMGGFLCCQLYSPILAAERNVTVGDTLQMDSVLRDSASAVTKVPADSLQKKSVPFQSESIDFNPLDYQMQKRYLEKGKPFKTKHFYDHIFMGAFSGFDRIVPRGGVNKDGLPFGLFIGNQFSRLHSLRLMGTYTTWTLPETRYRMKQASIDLDYLFDFSSYLYGYNPYRRFSVSGLIGVGYLKNSYYGDRHDIFKGQVGLHLALGVGTNLQFFAEPYVAVASGEVDVYTQSSVLNYDVMYGLRAGLAISLNSAEGYRRDSVYNGNLFFELSQGITCFANGNLPFLKTMGTGYQFSVGKWFDPVLGLRATASVSDYYWNSSIEPATVGSPEYETLCKGAMFSGRLEALVNPLNFFRSMRESDYHVFDVNLIGGAEYGWKINPMEGAPASLRCKYWGGTAAVQFLYNADANTSIFLEPRYTHGIYKIPYQNAAMDKKFVDQFVFLSAGVRINRPLKKDRMLHREDQFVPYFFVGGSVGGNKHMRTLNVQGDGSFNYQASVNGGYHLNPFVGFRLRFEYLNFARNARTPYTVDFMGMEKTFSALWKQRSGFFQTQLDYLLNLTNVYQGYNEDRKLNIYALFGPGYSVCVNQGASIYSKELSVGENPRPKLSKIKGNGAWSLTGGVLVDYKIHPNWSLFVDPQVQYYLKKGFIGGGSTSRLNDFFIKFSIGCSYKLFQ